MLSKMLPLHSPRYFSVVRGITRLATLGTILIFGAAPALGQPAAPVPTATVIKSTDGQPPQAATVPAQTSAALPSTSLAASPPSVQRVAPPAAEPVAGDELPSLAPSPLIEQRTSAAPSETDARALTEFRPTLDAYGAWVEHPSYGSVWVPRRDVVGDGFAPYVTSGRWALDTNGDWVWVSDYPFGPIVFHYGRWAHVGGTGWVWVPGYRYAPAWVTWRVPTGSYAYVGWAPLPPDYGWFGGVSVSLWWGYPTPWVFCPSAYAFHHHVDHYVVRDRGLVTRLAANSARYVPARPRARAGERTLAGPAPSEARIPAAAVPRERLQPAVVRADPRRLGPAVERSGAPPLHRAGTPAEPRLRAPSSLPDRRQHGPVAPGLSRRSVAPAVNPERNRPQHRVGAERVERRVEQTRIQRREPTRVERRPNFSRERVRMPRPSPAPLSPGSAPRLRRSK